MKLDRAMDRWGEMLLCSLNLCAHMPLESRLLATVNAIKVLGRHAPSTCSIEGNLLALVHVGGSRLSEEDVLAIASNRDCTSRIDLTPSVENLADKA
jgi:hypothetical protein